MTTKKPTPQTTKAQPLRIKILRDRLRALPSWARVKDLSKSEKVRKAMETTAAYHNANIAHRTKQAEDYRAKCRAVGDAIVLGDFEKALTLLQKLEAEVFGWG